MDRILIDGREKSCGAVVFTETDGAIRYLIVRGTSGNYSFPKGHIEAGEDEFETAAREIFEETGLRPAFLDGFRMTEAYRVKNGRMKDVVYFLARFGGEPVAPPADEIPEYGLWPFEEAYAKLPRESAKAILRAADEYLNGLKDGERTFLKIE
jgi:8-oxo-dGTP pyrophosphatase MutT (NUDIX family)